MERMEPRGTGRLRVGLSHLAPNGHALASCSLPFYSTEVREKRGKLRSSKVKLFRLHAWQGKKLVYRVEARIQGSRLPQFPHVALDLVLLPVR